LRSRAAISVSEVCITRLKAPFTRDRASMRRSSTLRSRERASSWTITSLSAVLLKMAPRPSSSRRIAGAFTRLPLWAIDTGPPSVVAQKGWALRIWLPPEVE
jgi:hypothetical protein